MDKYYDQSQDLRIRQHKLTPYCLLIKDGDRVIDDITVAALDANDLLKIKQAVQSHLKKGLTASVA